MTNIYFLLFPLVFIVITSAVYPDEKVTNGILTYYEGAGKGACGHQQNASSEVLVAVSRNYFTTPNPNRDPVCNFCLQVNYNGKSIMVPIKDQCPECPENHIDLSLPAFRKLENPIRGKVYGATFIFKNCKNLDQSLSSSLINNI